MAGLAIGGVLGILVAGQLEQHYGWRAAFLALGLPGFLIAALVLRIKDPTRPAAPSRQGPDVLYTTMKELEGVARRIVSTPTLALVFVGSALISFGMNGLVGWAPTFLARERDLSTAEASELLGTFGLLAGIAGTVTGGYLADKLRGRYPTARLFTSSAGFLIGAPLAIWLLFIRDMGLFVPVFAASFFFLTWYNGPLTAVLFDVTPPQIATTIAGAYFMFIHVAGDAIAFPLVGALSDEIGLQWAILLLPLASLLGALVVLFAVPHLTRDMGRATVAP